MPENVQHADEYLTVKNEANDSFEVKRSKFIGYIKPVKTVEDAQNFINAIKSKHWDAKHNVYAYVLRDGQIKRYSDDGEPQGTAGIPVLDVMVKENITDCVIVVTRYFGGILLGGGGLVRAYSHAASLAVSSGNVICMKRFHVCETNMDYTLYGRFPSLVSENGGKVIDTVFETDVCVKYLFPAKSIEAFEKKVQDLSSGKGYVNIIESVYDEDT